jgi:predicted DNA-binding WGR domain protein
MRERQIDLEDWLAADAVAPSCSLPSAGLPELHLRRIEPTKRMARFYSLSITRSLFDESLLQIRWGRIGTPGRTRTKQFACDAQAAEAARRTEGRKLRKGYRAV